MNFLFDFFFHGSIHSKILLGLSFLASGLLNCLILIIINSAAQEIYINELLELHLLLLFLVTFSLFIFIRRYTLITAITQVEKGLFQRREKITNQLRKTPLSFIEQTGKETIYTHLTQDMELIAQSAWLIIASLQASVIVVSLLFYVAWLSFISSLLIALCIAIGVYSYIPYANHVEKKLNKINQLEMKFFQRFNHMLQGFNEIKMNQKKNDALFKSIQHTTTQAKKIKSYVTQSSMMQTVYNNTLMLLLLGNVVFILPALNFTESAVTIKTVIALLFIVGPIEVIVLSIPMFIRANTALKQLRSLERKLEDVSKEEDIILSEDFELFQYIKFNNIQFEYHTDSLSSFKLEIPELIIKKGEMIFITGKNGCGKTTFLKLFSGLYLPTKGTIEVDKQIIHDDFAMTYRNIFATLFSDFHLFKKLYGAMPIDETKVKQLLIQMQLHNKTRFIDNHFTQTKLSTGQRKRLAYITAILEEKPILIFDEFAADQDPYFRRLFYEKILINLKQQGKTIIVSTHDEQYFSVADRVISITNGTIKIA